MSDLLGEALDLATSIGTDGPDVARRARQAITGVTTAALLADEHGRLLGVNAAAEVLTGYPAAELLRLSVADITHRSDTAVVEPLWRAFLATGQQRGQYQVRSRSGARVTVDYAAVRISPRLHLSLLRPSA